MERFYTFVFVAGIGCFAIAFLLSMVFPWMSLSDYHGMNYRTLEDIAAEPSLEFRQLAADYPEAFEASFGTSEPTPEAFATALQRGRDLYAGQACWHCHSQYVREVSNEEQRFGPPSVAQEYQNALNQPHLWGTRRVGPDLSREYGKRTNDWHIAHFIQPKNVIANSVMPAYPFYFQPDGTPKKDGFSLVTYVQWIGSEYERLVQTGSNAMIKRAVERPERDHAFTPLHYFFVLFVLVAGSMFFYKLFAFLSTIKRDELAGFAYDPMITYGLVAMGFLCLLGWAYASGQFRDIERPKYDMLERFDRQERAEAQMLGKLEEDES